MGVKCFGRVFGWWIRTWSGPSRMFNLAQSKESFVEQYVRPPITWISREKERRVFPITWAVWLKVGGPSLDLCLASRISGWDLWKVLWVVFLKDEGCPGCLGRSYGSLGWSVWISRLSGCLALSSLTFPCMRLYLIISLFCLPIVEGNHILSSMRQRRSLSWP